MAPRKKQAKDAVTRPGVQVVEQKITTSYTAPPGFKPWASGTRLVSGESLTMAVSQWRVDTGSFTQSVEVRHNELFTLKPLVITEGAYKGRHVLMLQPVTITDYFRFMDLPPELRKMVYDLVLLEKSEKITIESYKPVGQPRRPVRQGFRYTGRNDHKGMTWDKTRGKWIGQLPSNLGVLRVSHQVCAETASIFYGHHDFYCSDLAAMELFLHMMGEMRQYLKHISISENPWKPSKAKPALSLLGDAKSLRTLSLPHTLYCTDKSRWDPNRMSLETVVKDCGPMLKALCKARKNDDTAVSVFDIIKLPESEVCWQCKYNKEHASYRCSNMACGYPCAEQEEHHKAFAPKLRAAIANQLGITRFLEDGPVGE
ncbi:hypothetical protein B0A55_02348 [Friedmanniomyces simplex]|uniref:Uncharacterized protein n=1 Tax=Friedmanniomyces simplex TaxID=329884 RepID=A0A4U0Y057_9PEZI|nr:hypothetical protein B0A55_02348 [Friedmanniomyces simplex]